MDPDWQQIEYSICLGGCRSSVEICGLTGMQHLSIRTSLWCPPPLQHVALFSHNWWLNRDVQIPVFYPASRPASCISNHVPVAKNFKFAPRKKLSDVRSIRAWVHVSATLWWLCHNPLTEPLWSDYDSDSDTLCTVSDFMAAYGEGRQQDRWHTDQR